MVDAIRRGYAQNPSMSDMGILRQLQEKVRSGVITRAHAPALKLLLALVVIWSFVSANILAA
jgi:hypothetical protein